MKQYPDTEKTYGIVVTDATGNEELNEKRAHLERADPDNIVFLSVIPHDITARADWKEIESAFSAFPRRGVDVESVTAEQIEHLVEKITVLRVGRR